MNSSLESIAERPSFSISRTVIRSRFRSVKKSVIPSSGLSSLRADVRASSRILWAFCALLIHTFWPLTTQPPSTFSALVLMREVSTPAVGSVTPNAMRISPRASLGRNSCFISSEPCRMIGRGWEQVEVDRGGATRAGARGGDFLHHHAALRDAEPQPAVLARG